MPQRHRGRKASDRLISSGGAMLSVGDVGGKAGRVLQECSRRKTTRKGAERMRFLEASGYKAFSYGSVSHEIIDQICEKFKKSI